MKRALAGAGLLALLSTTAFAADLPRGSYKAPAYLPTAGFNWTGFYAGLHGGYSFSGGDLGLEGGFAGGQIGYNWQGLGSPFVFGVELDSAWADLGDSVVGATPFGVVGVRSDANYQGSFRGRVGYAFDRTMLYVTGGVGWINNELRVTAPIGPFLVTAVDEKTHVGGVVGVGIEQAFAPNWTGKIEYIYAGYGKETYFAGIGGGVRAEPETHTIKAGINYLFR